MDVGSPHDLLALIATPGSSGRGDLIHTAKGSFNLARVAGCRIVREGGLSPVDRCCHLPAGHCAVAAF